MSTEGIQGEKKKKKKKKGGAHTEAHTKAHTYTRHTRDAHRCMQYGSPVP